MIIRIAYIEDEFLHREYLSRLLVKSAEHMKLDIDRIDKYSSSEDFISKWRPDSYDLIILDIFINSESGIDLAKKIRVVDDSVKIAFCSSSNEFASESYEVQAVYYLNKPIDITAIDKMLSQVAKELNYKKETIILPDGQKFAPLDLICSEYHNHYITLFLKGDIQLQTKSSQQDFLSVISDYTYLYPITSGNVINFKETVSYDQGIFVMSNGRQLSVSRRRKKEAVAAYKAVLFDELQNW